MTVFVLGAMGVGFYFWGSVRCLCFAEFEALPSKHGKVSVSG